MGKERGVYCAWSRYGCSPRRNDSAGPPWYHHGGGAGRKIPARSRHMTCVRMRGRRKDRKNHKKPLPVFLICGLVFYLWFIRFPFVHVVDVVVCGIRIGSSMVAAASVANIGLLRRRTPAVGSRGEGLQEGLQQGPPWPGSLPGTHRYTYPTASAVPWRAQRRWATRPPPEGAGRGATLVSAP